MLREIDQLIALVAKAFAIGDPAALKGRSRSKRTLWARQAAAMILRDLHGFSYPELGRFFSKDHTTMLMGIRVARMRMQSDRLFRSMVDEALDAIAASPVRATRGLLPCESSARACCDPMRLGRECFSEC